MSNAGIAVVGDVHGDARRLRDVLSDERIRERTVVFVGDYVNRGGESRQVLDLLVAARRSMGDRLVLLMGNHDMAFLRVLTTGRQVASFLSMGGDQTVLSYLPEVPPDVVAGLQQAVPPSHLQLLKELRSSWEGGGLLVVHSVDDPAVSYDVAEARRLVVVGHHIQAGGPIRRGNVFFIDTGCGSSSDGTLTALLAPELEWVTF